MTERLIPSVAMCDECRKYHNLSTDYLETFYYCILDDDLVIERGIEEMTRCTPRIDGASLKHECRDFEEK